jgi:hypothetical protein
MSLRSDWRFWLDLSWTKLTHPMLPVIYDGPKPPEWMNKHSQIPPESVGYFDWRTGAIWIRDGETSWAVRWHEYGHWAFWRLHHLLDALWELPWWGLGMRRLFIKK